MTVIVVEDDKVLRMLQPLLDPDTPPERIAAVTDYVAHDLDFESWCAAVRARVPKLYPASVRLVATQEALRANLAGSNALVVESLRMDEAGLAAVPGLALVQKFGLSTANIDLAACERRGVPVRTLRRRSNIAVAEHTLALMLALAKQLHRLGGRVSAERLRDAGYDYRKFDTRYTGANNYGRVGGLRVLRGSTLGVLGMGEIGRELASLVRPFGMTVKYHQRRRLRPEDEKALGVVYCSFTELFEGSDTISVHVPLNAETRGLVNRDALQRIRPGAALINTSRAEIVDRAALIEALESRRLGAAALDVHYQEPCAPDDPLLRFDNVLMTPHFAGGPRTALLGDLEEIVFNIEQALKARHPAPQ